jgi:hypothetical protein
MEGNRNKEGLGRDEIFSKAVRAGKRTYFFDVKTTKMNDFYLTITESKKRFDPEGNYRFEKHKLFLYKEDFEKFACGLQEVVEYIKTNHVEGLEVMEGSTEVDDFTDVDFDDLDEN